jgi:hypothetical protein
VLADRAHDARQHARARQPLDSERKSRGARLTKKAPEAGQSYPRDGPRGGAMPIGLLPRRRGLVDG